MNKFQCIAADIRATVKQHPDFVKGNGDLYKVCYDEWAEQGKETYISVCALGAAACQHLPLPLNNEDKTYDRIGAIYGLDFDDRYRIWNLNDSQMETASLLEIAAVLETWE